ncbi:MAG: hypothetical protein E6776_06780, partial [Eggerthella sp.]|nr:hypothetical protein [Eggerthella sp.]
AIFPSRFWTSYMLAPFAVDSLRLRGDCQPFRASHAVSNTLAASTGPVNDCNPYVEYASTIHNYIW